MEEVQSPATFSQEIVGSSYSRWVSEVNVERYNEYVYVSMRK